MRKKNAKQTKRRDAGRPRGTVVETTILAKTLEEIAAHGIENASIERIAQASELNKTSVYRRFRNRDALIAKALETVLSDIDAILVDQGSLRLDLLFVARQIRILVETPVGRDLARAAMSESDGESVLSTLAAKELGEPRPSVLALVARAKERGEWRRQVAPEVLFGALVGGILHRVLMEHQRLNDHFIESLVDLLVMGSMR